ncbi:protein DOUBLE-STRAND BREAK FORMATION isoform X2 [Amaranthus tricolor]|uniref:protein DOUBLE-STRAND BREAK FORMATION isoform X2 n=1 Tax=Amaranthus tricolor TaxID=29722 RepID=UPI0025828DCB|nr:protein DOUBLE-STRAND BREAK FORMATION isoform X2 [Amaranthus tricolor]
MAGDILHHQQVSLFCSQIKLRRFDDSTLRILELILSAKNVNLSLELRNNLKEVLRSQSLIAIREVADKSVEHKVLILDFFVRAFAIVDDVESCLALRYEGLNFRESRTMNHPELHVSYGEWMNFAEDAFNNSFYSVTAKACENALLCLNVNGNFISDKLAGNAKTVRKLQSLKDMAIRLCTSHCVQGQAAEYMRKKTLNLKQSLFSEEAESTASMCFRDGIKQQNIRNLLRLKYQ